ncbi:MAG TPA: mechanosensitive ion channel domain-containing protein [Terriglobia bacterium]|nr:mechanosensitive ion channel domain-containing protein [Terriglobia bacterium]
MKVLLICLLAIGTVLAGNSAAAQAPATPIEPATLYFQNREIVTLRSMRGSFTPQDRVAGAERRLRDELRASGPGEITTVSVDGAVAVMMRTTLIFTVLRDDLDPELVGQEATTDAAAQAAARRLDLAVDAWSDQRKAPVIARGVLHSLVALVLAMAAIWIVARVRVVVTGWLTREAKHRVEEKTAPKGINLIDPVLKLMQLLVGLGRIAVLAGIVYLWCTYVFSQFPLTSPWASKLADFVTSSFSTVFRGILTGIPTLFLAVLILTVTRLFAYTVKTLFDSVASGHVRVRGIYSDTADAMRRIAVVLVWIFGIAMAFPFLPGSNSDAVRGVSVLVGLMITLGSSGVISQAMSGLVVVFSRAIRENEYVCVGEYEGTVTQVGALSAKIRTPRNEEITIPNSVLVSTPTRNYSRLAGTDGVVLQTSVGIGYDAPWRDVHDMLIEAVYRTPGLRKTPSPFVRQATLSSFCVDYTINAYLDRPETRLAVLSELHANIQDIFNEREVQIMTPAFESQPDQPVLVPKRKSLGVTSQSPGQP